MKPTIATFTNAMGRGIRDQHDHLARVLSPIHIQGFVESGGYGFGTISPSRCIEAAQILVDLGDVGGKAEVFDHVSMILRWVITVGNQSNAEVLRGLQLAGFKDMGADGLDVLGSGGDVASLASRAILDKYKIPRWKKSVRRVCRMWGWSTAATGVMTILRTAGLQHLPTIMRLLGRVVRGVARGGRASVEIHVFVHV